MLRNLLSIKIVSFRDSSDEDVIEDKRQIVKLSNMLNSGEPGQQNPDWSYMNQRSNPKSYNVTDDWRIRSFKYRNKNVHNIALI